MISETSEVRVRACLCICGPARVFALQCTCVQVCATEQDYRDLRAQPGTSFYIK